jgi:diadenosine tetraphosphatase ApaH/serine/threonine PP2A family protein phosphatase
VSGVRYLVISDIHANIDALEAVLAAAAPWDRVLVLGDLVGYGAEPNAVIDRVRALDPTAVIRGNHDKAACGLDDGANFNQVARFAAAWTHQQLTPGNREYLRQLPHGPVEIDERMEICHGAPFDEDHYIFDGSDAQHALEAASRQVCVFGHTHLPVVFMARAEGLAADVPDDELRTLPFQEGTRYLINPGSVGQPRDGDPRAAYGFYDSAGRMEFARIEYNVAAAQRRVSAAGLPQSLANRLAIGR